MYVDFNDLPNDARVWIYQANRALSETEVQEAAAQLKSFTTQWKAHGADLRASFLIKYNQFIVIAADENYNGASGCSIDASVHTIQTIEKQLDIDLMNKMNVAFKDGENVNMVSMGRFKEFAKEHKVTDDTIVFNNMVATKADFMADWETTANNSWHARFLN